MKIKEIFVTKIIKRVAPNIGAAVVVDVEYGFVVYITFQNRKRVFFRVGTSILTRREHVRLLYIKATVIFFGIILAIIHLKAKHSSVTSSMKEEGLRGQLIMYLYTQINLAFLLFSSQIT